MELFLWPIYVAKQGVFAGGGAVMFFLEVELLCICWRWSCYEFAGGGAVMNS